MHDELDKYIQKHKEEFDYTPLPEGHKSRFLDKLDDEFDHQTHKSKRGKSFWMSIAAAITLLLGISSIFLLDDEEQLTPAQEEHSFALNKVSPELKEVESFFISKIALQKEKLNNYEVIETDFQDYFNQIKELEAQYKELEQELAKNMNNERIIQAMIQNYQLRTKILEQMMKNLSTKQNQNKRHENKQA